MTHEDSSAQAVTEKGQSQLHREKAPGGVPWSPVLSRMCFLRQLRVLRTNTQSRPPGKLPRLESRLSPGSPSWKLQRPRGKAGVCRKSDCSYRLPGKWLSHSSRPRVDKTRFSVCASRTQPALPVPPGKQQAVNNGGLLSGPSPGAGRRELSGHR